jgi:hypothetical protein
VVGDWVSRVPVKARTVVLFADTATNAGLRPGAADLSPASLGGTEPGVQPDSSAALYFSRSEAMFSS